MLPFRKERKHKINKLNKVNPYVQQEKSSQNKGFCSYGK